MNQQRVLSLLKEDEETSVCGIALNLSEEDLLRLSSARVDENLFEGTYLYAVIYQADFENAAVTTYPVNPQVFTLMQWDPNIVSLFTVKKEQEKRSVLENHLQLFTQKEMGNSIEAELESLPDSQEELPEQDNNISQLSGQMTVYLCSRCNQNFPRLRKSDHWQLCNGGYFHWDPNKNVH